MIDVKDRVPTKAGRTKITKDDGSIEYVTIERADEPVEPGTPINKALFNSIKEDIFNVNSYLIPSVEKVVKRSESVSDSELVASSTDDYDSSTQYDSINGYFSTLNTGLTPTAKIYSLNGGKVGYKSDSGLSDYFSTSANTVKLLQMLQRSTYSSNYWLYLYGDAALEYDLKSVCTFNCSIYLNTVGSGLGKSDVLKFEYSNDGISWTSQNISSKETTVNITARYIRYSRAKTYSTSLALAYMYITNISSTKIIYTNKFTIDEFDEIKLNQKIKLAIPNDLDMIINVEDNTLNDLPIEDILQPDTRYDLFFDGEKVVDNFVFDECVEGVLNSGASVELSKSPRLVIGIYNNSDAYFRVLDVNGKTITNSKSYAVGYIAYF